MSAVAEKELIDLVVGWVKENGLKGSNHTEISENTNLLESGLLDSFAFVDLVLFIENYTRKKLDLIDVDPTRILIVKSSIFTPVRIALRDAGLWARVLNTGPVPFPSHGNQQTYRSLLRRALRRAHLP